MHSYYHWGLAVGEYGMEVATGFTMQPGEGLTSILSMAVSLPQRLAGAFLEMGVGRKWARAAMPQNLPKIRNPIAESPVFRGTTSLLPKTSAPEKRMWPDFKAHIRMTLQSYSRCSRILFLFGFIFKL